MEKISVPRATRIFIVVLLILLIIGQTPLPYAQQSAISLSAVDADDTGVAVSSRFLLTLPEPDSLESLATRVTSDPEIAFTVTDGEAPLHYYITPLNPLPPGAPVTFYVDGQRFSFAVRNELAVTSVYPKDGAVDVPVNAGVELAFNTPDVDMGDLNASCSFFPEISGRFTRKGNRIVFQPDEHFEYGTFYTFTLAQGFADRNSVTMPESYSFRFFTERDQSAMWQNEKTFELSGAGLSVNMLSDEPPAFQATISGYADVTTTVELATFDSAESFREAVEMDYKDSRDYFLKRMDLPVVATMEVEPFAIPDDYRNASRWVIPLPEALAPGWYRVGFTMSGQSRYLLLQVSELSVYYAAAEGEMLVWVNDTVTGQPVSGAQVTFTGDMTASLVTDAQGVARASYTLPALDPEEWYRTIQTSFTVRDGDRVFVGDNLSRDYGGYYGAATSADLRYMGYLYTDRSIYRTTDTIQVWGVVRRRDPSAPLPETVEVTLGEDVVSLPVVLLPDGTFTASIPLESLSPRYYQLALMVDSASLYSTYLNIMDFVKPVYTAKNSPDQPVWLMMEDKTAGATVQVTTFDGTPAADYKLGVNHDGDLSITSSELVTDENGYAAASFKVTSDPDTWYPQDYYYYFLGRQEQQENFYSYGRIRVIHRDVVLKGKPSFGESSNSVEVTTHRVDISDIEEEGQLWEKDALMGAPLSQKVTAEVYHVYYKKIPTGQYYDFANREWKESFQYERQEDLVETREVATKNGSVTLDNLPVADWEEGYYYVQLTTDDSLGRKVVTTTHLSSMYDRYSSYDDGIHRYTLTKRQNTDTASAEESYGEYHYYWRGDEFVDDEDVTFQLRDNDDLVSEVPGRILSFVAQDGVSQVSVVSETNELTLPFSESLMPNYVISGAYFDGRRIFALSETSMRFNPKHRELEISLAPDKEFYAPGDEMTVAVTVKNKTTGLPTANTSVLLSVVDEAVFAVEEQYISLLSTLYKSIYYPRIFTYTSYTQFVPDYGPGEKGGGGGDDSVREDFKDTPYFDMATTDADGRATILVSLPDNITSWRMTSLAISPENHAGHTTDNVSSTQDFFLMPVLAEQLLEGDSLVVGLRSSGRGVKSSDAVNYTVRVEGGGAERTASSTVHEYASVDLGTLKSGDYAIFIEGISGDFRDAVRLPLSVVTSGVEVSMTETFLLSDGIKIDPLRYPVSISFYGANSRDYNNTFSAVASRASGGRAEARLAARYIALQYKRSGAVWYDAKAAGAGVGDLTGVLSPLPQAESDTELTVKGYLACPDVVRPYALESLVAPDSTTPGRKSAVILAKALAGEEIEPGLEEMIGAADNYIDKIYLTMALASFGQKEAALRWYKELVTDKMKELTGITGVKAYYISEEDPMSTLDATAAASMLATMLDTAESHGLVRYLAEKRQLHGEPYLLEMIYYLESFELGESSGGDWASFRYTRDGEDITVNLSRRMTSISFTREQLAEANFTVLSGQVYADVYYAASPAQELDQSKKLIRLTKKIEAADGGEITSGTLVKVTLTPDISAFDLELDSTQMIINDHIPTGMRFERYDYDYQSRGWHLLNRQGQRLEFCVYGAEQARRLAPIVYYARCATPGDYVMESAYISSYTSDIWGSTERSQVTIR